MQHAIGAWTERATGWAEAVASSRRAQFAATAVASGTVVAALLLSYQSLRTQERLQALKESIPTAPRPIEDHVSCTL